MSRPSIEQLDASVEKALAAVPTESEVRAVADALASRHAALREAVQEAAQVIELAQECARQARGWVALSEACGRWRDIHGRLVKG